MLSMESKIYFLYLLLCNNLLCCSRLHGCCVTPIVIGQLFHKPYRIFTQTVPYLSKVTLQR